MQGIIFIVDRARVCEAHGNNQDASRVEYCAIKICHKTNVLLSVK